MCHTSRTLASVQFDWLGVISTMPKVRDLMFFLEAQKMVESSGGASDLRDATVLPMAERPAAKPGRCNKGK